MTKEIVRNYLKASCNGSRRALSSMRLSHVLDISEKELRKSVNRLRSEGVPIASDNNGYYYASTASEVYRTIQNLKKLTNGLNRAITGLEASMAKFGCGDSK